MSFAKTVLKAAVAASMIAVPAVATASTAASALSLSNRIGAEVEGENLGGGFIIPALAIVALGLGVWAAVDDDEAESA